MSSRTNPAATQVHGKRNDSTSVSAKTSLSTGTSQNSSKQIKATSICMIPKTTTGMASLESGFASQDIQTTIHASCRRCHHWHDAVSWNFSVRLEEYREFKCTKCGHIMFGLGGSTSRSAVVSQETIRSLSVTSVLSTDWILDRGYPQSLDAAMQSNQDHISKARSEHYEPRSGHLHTSSVSLLQIEDKHPSHGNIFFKNLHHKRERLVKLATTMLTRVLRLDVNVKLSSKSNAPNTVSTMHKVKASSSTGATPASKISKESPELQLGQRRTSIRFFDILATSNDSTSKPPDTFAQPHASISTGPMISNVEAKQLREQNMAHKRALKTQLANCEPACRLGVKCPCRMQDQEEWSKQAMHRSSGRSSTGYSSAPDLTRGSYTDSVATSRSRVPSLATSTEVSHMNDRCQAPSLLRDSAVSSLSPASRRSSRVSHVVEDERNSQDSVPEDPTRACRRSVQQGQLIGYSSMMLGRPFSQSPERASFDVEGLVNHAHGSSPLSVEHDADEASSEGGHTSKQASVDRLV